MGSQQMNAFNALPLTMGYSTSGNPYGMSDSSTSSSLQHHGQFALIKKSGGRGGRSVKRAG